MRDRAVLLLSDSVGRGLLNGRCLIASPLCYSDALVVMGRLTSDSHGIDRHERETDMCWAIHSEAALPGSRYDDRARPAEQPPQGWVLYSTGKRQVEQAEQSKTTRRAGERSAVRCE